MKPSLAAAAVLSCLLLAACARPTPYDSYFYAPTASEMEGDKIWVSARGNMYTDWETIEAFGMLKAAEATLENNHQSFKVIEAKTRDSFTTMHGYWQILRMQIQVFPEPGDTGADGERLDAREIIAELGPKHLPKD